jgi:tetraacyldisaccharide 4'-kinase
MNAARLQQLWYSGQAPGPALRALEHLYSRLRAFDHKHQLARRAHDLEGRPIIVVGNRVVGGTGKTPLLVRLVELLQAQHLNVAVISRGYGSGRKAPVNVTTESDVAQAGDEPLLIARRTGASVRVDPDREAAARAVLAGGAQVVLSDDGLQRMSLPRALEVCVVDGARGFGNGHLLPAGPLREPPERLASVDWVVCNGEPRAGLDLPGAVPMRLQPGAFRRLGDGETRSVAQMAAHLQHSPGQAIAGIGHPQRFFKLLETLQCQTRLQRAFADHHTYSARDFSARSGTLLMTEKDAVKCEGLGLHDAWYLPVEAVLPPSFEQAFVGAVRTLLDEA